MQELVRQLFSGKRIAVLGFGREGRSSYRLIKSVLPSLPFLIADRNTSLQDDPELRSDENVMLKTGKDYLQGLEDFDYLVKTPGISTKDLPVSVDRGRITSQTDLFLQKYHQQVTGITGTKGKSTTSSLVYHILKASGATTLLVGNIGVPPFDMLDKITPATKIVMELSSHQLEYLKCSPHIAILLNIFQEHLDHYYSYANYQAAKFNIGLYQEKGDYFIYNSASTIIAGFVNSCQSCLHTLVPFSLGKNPSNSIGIAGGKFILSHEGKEVELYDLQAGVPLRGDHNLANMMAAAAACYLAGVKKESIREAIAGFKGLEHRIEYVGLYDGIHFYNDSIATIPEATIEAVKALKEVDTLILGGFDRGIEYSHLVTFLVNSEVQNLILVGDVGKRIRKGLDEITGNTKHLFMAENYQQVVDIAKKETLKGKICLLSPAAASYDMFGNFEERGNIFKKIVRGEKNLKYP